MGEVRAPSHDSSETAFRHYWSRRPHGIGCSIRERVRESQTGGDRNLDGPRRHPVALMLEVPGIRDCAIRWPSAELH
jgi:hypothetical protein